MIQRRIVVFFLTVLLSGSVLTATAQTPTTSGIPDDDQLAGLLSSVWRDYAPTGVFFGEATTASESATPESAVADQSPIRTISVVVREFDTAGSADLALTQISSGVEASLPTIYQDGTVNVTSEELPNIGSQATLIRMDSIGKTSSVWLEYVLVQREQYLFVVYATGSAFLDVPGSDDVDTSLPTAGIATDIALNGEPSPNDVSFVADGTSTGGLWAFMPASEDPLLMGLAPYLDVTLYSTTDD